MNLSIPDNLIFHSYDFGSTACLIPLNSTDTKTCRLDYDATLLCLLNENDETKVIQDGASYLRLASAQHIESELKKSNPDCNITYPRLSGDDIVLKMDNLYIPELNKSIDVDGRFVYITTRGKVYLDEWLNALPSGDVDILPRADDAILRKAYEDYFNDPQTMDELSLVEFAPIPEGLRFKLTVLIDMLTSLHDFSSKEQLYNSCCLRLHTLYIAISSKHDELIYDYQNLKEIRAQYGLDKLYRGVENYCLFRFLCSTNGPVNVSSMEEFDMYLNTLRNIL